MAQGLHLPLSMRKGLKEEFLASLKNSVRGHRKAKTSGGAIRYSMSLSEKNILSNNGLSRKVETHCKFVKIATENKQVFLSLVL